jgi:hypothetical protein
MRKMAVEIPIILDAVNGNPMPEAETKHANQREPVTFLLRIPEKKVASRYREKRQ